MPNHLNAYRKQNAAAQALRKRIVEGRLAPGARVPTLRDLSGQLKLSPVTLQKATNRLAREGFLRPMGSRGTFVAEHPPHLCRYAIAFPSRLDGTRYWTDTWTLLLQAAEAVARADGRIQIAPFYGITGNSDVEDYQRLMADADARRLAGIILLSGPHLILDSELLNNCPVPRVYIGGDVSDFGMASVSPDMNSFYDRALELALRHSRRRPIVISPSATDYARGPWEAACRKHGMTPARWQVVSVPPAPDPGARHVTQILMQLPQESRPDVLIVTDDHFVEDVSAGLLASGVPEAELPLVIAIANFPTLPRATVPVTYLGFDSRRIIRACLDSLETQRLGKETVVSLIPAQFAAELPAADRIAAAASNDPLLNVR